MKLPKGEDGKNVASPKVPTHNKGGTLDLMTASGILRAKFTVGTGPPRSSAGQDLTDHYLIKGLVHFNGRGRNLPG